MEYNIVDTIMTLNDQCGHLNVTCGDENKLSAKELQVMLSLNSGESVSNVDLAKRNILSPSRLDRIVDKLTSRGFLNRETDEHDGDYSRVALTNEGIIINKNAFAFKKQCESKIKSRLSDHEFAVIQKALHLLLFAMENEYRYDTSDSTEHY